MAKLAAIVKFKFPSTEEFTTQKEFSPFPSVRLIKPPVVKFIPGLIEIGE